MNLGNGRISRIRCKSCHNKQTIDRGQKNKQLYVDYKGGKCEKCNYNKCIDALEFHHLDPNEKDPNFKSIRYWGLEKAKIELNKCALLCSNCHREEHFKQKEEQC